jgi:WhiB family redox-sensing transcriptional regulator
MSVLRLLKEQGSCRGEPYANFYPSFDSPSSTAYAISICERCPVRAECLDWALENDEFGVWGGTSEATRRSLKRPRPRAKCISCQSENVISEMDGKHELCVDCGLSWSV